MNSGQYILPLELVVLLGFVLLPAVVCTVAAQAYYLQRRKMLSFSPGKSALGLVATVLLGVTGAVAVFVNAPASWGGTLGIRDVRLFGHLWPVWPFGFLTLGVSGCVTTWWLLRGAGRAA
jgi:hypothetical protein